MFNLKNKECQAKFKAATSTNVNNGMLSSIFDEEEDLNVLTNKFIKKLNKIIQSCFRKIRVTEKKDEVKETLNRRWRNLKTNTDQKSKD